MDQDCHWYKEGLDDGRNGTFIDSFDRMTQTEIDDYQTGWQIGCHLRAYLKGRLIVCR